MPDTDHPELSDAPSLTISTCESITDIGQEQWEALAGRGNPFLRFEFFEALEDTGCTTPETGWQPQHLVIKSGDSIVGVAPGYLKSHSMGEYVFDFAWAEAFQRYGIHYYPKLLIAVPFTPSRGPRLLITPEVRNKLAPGDIPDLLNDLIEELNVQSWHLLFPDEADQALLSQDSELHRIGCQFHWQNRDYQNFDDFLGELTSRKRKAIRKERKQVVEQGITFVRYHGRDISDSVLSTFYIFYQATYLKRGQRPYLNKAFFEQLRERLPEHLSLIMAVQDGRMIAGALFMSGENTLYGRYWGCLDEYNFLHFETCYYQGIELAIERGLSRFDAGAQGEHKLIRGFEPAITHSWHGIAHPGFREAIEAFTQDEAKQVQNYFDEAYSVLPFKQATDG
ncbi:GNAT family N-acetyltransferase [Marinobacter sp. CHS3-4]|uniref:GNAT family N-acetyltransferase n=1 Tax=Marinobacter sp. CHS3-4 TaxID=3045174 RepID=UPI0024B5CA26|nr:GNAT family N-acetyltransferase [Marinobacter sp. CHS3-4]MDI9244790.1 GNAT family N-acetyltransferase [Marinobacter sp. CHS3-4]